ncbi:hypothetical protein F442_04819 [Phytophthora nicotianae P10297]|uniref:Transposase Tc1-like domain-containing protein n=1 Tax=Phytophthora nicotianae P10297 TaxID=1317064 RepID=W2ZR07_PHYNI|nr:hypothetical protein F442_04819 [Phytophthora nicotianae P10297]
MGERVAAVVKSRKHARGRKKKDRGELCKRLAEVAVNDRENQRAVQEGSGVSSYLVQQLIKEGFLRHALRQTRPLLTPSHRLRRLRFCMDHVIPQQQLSTRAFAQGKADTC